MDGGADLIDCTELWDDAPPPTEADAPKGKGDEAKEGRGPSQATRLLQIADSKEIELFHAPDRKPYATIQHNGHAEVWPVRSTDFKGLLSLWYFEATGSAAGGTAVSEAREALAARAIHRGPTLPVYVRVGELGGALYLDLGDPQWRVVEITSAGWKVLPVSPVKFKRPPGLLALPVPVPEGSVDDLRPFVNVESDDDWILVLAWLVAMFRPRGPYPLIALSAEQGSGKTMLSRILRSIGDPSASLVRAEPKEVRDLVIAANNGAVVCLDNLSTVPAWLSDALCRLSTGGGLSTRVLYSDDEEQIFDVQRPVILNGIEELTTRGDLLDRALVLRLPRLKERKQEAEVWRDFHEKHAGILGALLDAVSGALLNLPQTRLESPPRMADFAAWAVAAEHELGLEDGDFLRAYSLNRQGAHELALEASPIASVLKEYAATLTAQRLIKDTRIWAGTATDLLRELTLRAGGRERQAGWPRNAKALSGALRRLAPNLRAVGLDLVFDKTGREGEEHKKTRQIEIWAQPGTHEGPHGTQGV